MSFNEGIITAYCDGLAGKEKALPTTDRYRSQAACDLGRRHRQHLIAHYKAYGECASDAERFDHCWDVTCACHIA